MKKIYFYDRIEEIFSNYIPGILCFFMGLFITTEVLGRLIINRSWQGLVDIVENFVVLIAFLSLANVQSKRSHIAVDILFNKLKGRRAYHILDCFLLGMGIFTALMICGELIWYTIRAHSTGMTTVTLFWPVWPFGMAMALGMFFYAFRMLIQFKQSFLNAMNWKKLN
jgi:TRAP-type C4-dicarboxylate transport system permease small subunit